MKRKASDDNGGSERAPRHAGPPRRPPHSWRVALRLFRATARAVTRLCIPDVTATLAWSKSGSRSSKDEAQRECCALAEHFLGAHLEPAELDGKDGRNSLAAALRLAFPGNFDAADVDALVG